MNINESFRWSCVLCLSWYFNFQIQQIWTIRLHHLKNVCIVSSNCALTITTFRKKLRKTVQQILMMTSIVTSLLPLKSQSCQGNVWDLSGEAFCFSCLLNHLLSHDCLLIFSSPYNLFFLPWQFLWTFFYKPSFITFTTQFDNFHMILHSKTTTSGHSLMLK